MSSQVATEIQEMQEIKALLHDPKVQEFLKELAKLKAEGAF